MYALFVKVKNMNKIKVLQNKPNLTILLKPF